MEKVTKETRLRICKGKSLFADVTPCTAGEMTAMMQDPRVRQICNDLKQMKKGTAEFDAKKKELPVLCFNAWEFEGNKRSDANGRANMMAMLDIDDVTDPRALVQSWGTTEQLVEKGIYMVHVSCSGAGVHLIIGLQPHETIEMAQRRVAEALGLEKFDGACKDVSRTSFAVPQDYVLMFCPEAFIFDQQQCEAADKAYRANEKRQATKKASAMKTPDDKAELAEVVEEIKDKTEEVYEGLPLKKVADYIQKSILGLDKDPQEGDHTRHNHYMELLSFLRYVCDNEVKLMLEVAPSWGLPEEERRQMCESMAGYAYKKMPRQLRRLIEQMKAELSKAESNQGMVNRHRPLPKALPKIIRHLVKMFPQQYKEVVVQASLPLLGTLTTALRYKKDPYNEMASTFLTYVYGPLASGKSFTRVLSECLLTPVIAEDERAQAELQKWKDEREALGNGKGPKRPHLIMRQIFPDFTTAALNQQIIDAKEQHLIFFTEESDNFVMDRKFSAKLRESYDGVRTGQTRVSVQSVSGGARSNINMLVCGTPMALSKMLSNPEDGLVSRFNLVAMPVSNGFERLKWGELTQKEQGELEQIIGRLYGIGLIQPVETDEQGDEVPFMQNTYEKVYVKMPRAERRIEAWIERMQAELDADPQKVALGRFARRIPDFMRRVALVLFACEGMKETSASLDLMEWMGDEALQTLLDRYGRKYEQICDDQAAENHIYQRNCKAADLYDAMDDRFSVADLIAKRKQMGMSDSIEAANTSISRWKSRGLVRVESTDEQGQRLYVKVMQLEVAA